MRRLIAALPIRAKVSLVIVLTCSLILVGALALLLGAQWKSAKSQHFESIRAAATTIGHSCAPALQFDSDEFAAGALQDVQLVESVVDASVFQPDGRCIARWQRSPGPEDGADETTELRAGEERIGDELRVTQEIVEGGSVVGVVVLQHTPEAYSLFNEDLAGSTAREKEPHRGLPAFPRQSCAPRAPGPPRRPGPTARGEPGASPAGDPRTAGAPGA